ncbi:hypothetical protein AB6A40_002174 [Gnathostoma spinigerum]|uniref:Uncharacterized protein n=1 Tax=Gnathostoma spinigerum TaxID=75299 RepID=A0ABD6EGM1_9BILA
MINGFDSLERSTEHYVKRQKKENHAKCKRKDNLTFIEVRPTNMQWKIKKKRENAESQRINECGRKCDVTMDLLTPAGGSCMALLWRYSTLREDRTSPDDINESLLFKAERNVVNE